MKCKIKCQTALFLAFYNKEYMEDFNLYLVKANDEDYLCYLFVFRKFQPKEIEYFQ